MSKQSKLAAWQSPAPVVEQKVVLPVREEKKIEKLADAILVEEPVVETPPVEAVNEPVVETKPEVKKIKKTKVAE
jgi:hypothetical protein